MLANISKRIPLTMVNHNFTAWNNDKRIDKLLLFMLFGVTPNVI